MTKQQIQMMPRASAPKPLTEEEKKMKIMQFLQQKREAFSINILCSLLHSNPDTRVEDVVGKAVYLADKLMEKLYPIEEEKKDGKD